MVLVDKNESFPYSLYHCSCTSLELTTLADKDKSFPYKLYHHCCISLEHLPRAHNPGWQRRELSLYALPSLLHLPRAHNPESQDSLKWTTGPSFPSMFYNVKYHLPKMVVHKMGGPSLHALLGGKISAQPVTTNLSTTENQPFNIQWFSDFHNSFFHR